MTTTNPAVPTQKELTSFIDKLFEFIEKILAFFKEISEKLEKTFVPYKSVYDK